MKTATAIGMATAALLMMVTGRVRAAIAVALGKDHSCALMEDSTVKCWGMNGFSQLGAESSDRCALFFAGFFEDCSELPLSVEGLDGVVQIAAGSYHTCALRNDGLVWCWGWNAFAQLGAVTTDLCVREGVGDTSPCSRTPLQVEDFGEVVHLEAGTFHTCAVAADGTMWCWGANPGGQLGTGVRIGGGTMHPVMVPEMASVREAEAGGNYSCAMSMGGDVQCWGAGWNCQLGGGMFNETGSCQAHRRPVNVHDVEHTVSLAAGEVHTCAAREDGSVACWGSNGDGQGGPGLPPGLLTATDVPGVDGVLEVEVNITSTCARNRQGEIRCWGNLKYVEPDGSGYGITYDGVQTQNLPSPAVGLAMGADDHACAVLEDASVWCWGANLMGGKLGHGAEMVYTMEPVQVIGL